jgi:hypothetical protein
MGLLDGLMPVFLFLSAAQARTAWRKALEAAERPTSAITTARRSSVALAKPPPECADILVWEDPAATAAELGRVSPPLFRRGALKNPSRWITLGYEPRVHIPKHGRRDLRVFGRPLPTACSCSSSWRGLDCTRGVFLPQSAGNADEHRAFEKRTTSADSEPPPGRY